MHVFTRTARARRTDRTLAAVLFVCGAPFAFFAVTSVAQDGHYYGDDGAHLAAAAGRTVDTLVVIATAGVPLVLLKYWLSAAVHISMFTAAALAATQLAS
ncbi:hypothetical protein DY218_13405 [Streptomyces triticagri]|uniref:DUF998 domain-containing protein n=1 Tax=Streptomyces triticagri TaxID=2293568 RepID=A0A372M5B8_9ACTN|nr:hypothetical protein [Streptomyces triticagri]RFU86124.1 hypothetical protein DY218_13405 [Streptomyces triticagri]